MANVIINDSNLIAIGNAIREKNGTEDTYKPREMAAAIAAIETGGGGSGECTGLHIPEEALTITGDCSYRFASGGWNWFIEAAGDKLTTKDITNASYMFNALNLTSIPFDINISSSSMVSCSYLFNSCKALTRLPYVKGKIGETNYLFYTLNDLREIPEDWADNIDWSGLHTTTTKTMVGTINNCHSLRKIPANLMSNLWSNGAYYYSVFSSGFFNLYVLDELKGMVPKTGAYTSNAFSNTFISCMRVKDITFALQEDGTPYTVSWKNQTIDLTSNIGYAKASSNVTVYNSGITIDKQVTDDANYQALKNDPDWFTTDIAYSRYNHDSAVNTINSLPITTNTGCSIKFKGAAGAKTDGGAINTLTEEEIAVATAKGWTVTFA